MSAPAFAANVSASMLPEHRARDDDLVDELDHLAHPDAADVVRRAHRFEHGLRGGEVFVGRADHDGERPRGRARRAAGHGRVGETVAARAQARVERARRDRRDGRHVDEQRARLGAARRAAIAEEHFLDLRRIGHARHDDVARRADAGRVAAVVRAQHAEPFDGLAVAVRAHRDVEASAQQRRRHRLAHRAHTDHPYLDCHTSRRVRALRTCRPPTTPRPRGPSTST